MEIGTEEIPARFLPAAVRQLEESAKRILADARLPAKSIAAYATPCRLVLHVMGLPAAAATRVVEKSGPPWDAAFDAAGKPTAALTGFLKSSGAAAKDIFKLEKKDRVFVGVRLTEKGRTAGIILPQVLPGLISSLHFPKNMRWRTGDPSAFARPIRWILCILGRKALRFTAYGLTASARTFGNKFFFPKPFRPSTAADYFRHLEKRGVMVSAGRRREKILKETRRLLARKNFKCDMPEALLSEVVHLTEYPTALLGRFDERFLDIPDVILKSAMTHHQRYFPVLGRGGKIAPYFLVVRNGPPDRRQVVARGNARVLTARFSDAKYFFENDRKKKLADRIEGLKRVVHLEGLGSLHDRARRIRDLMVILPPRIGVEIDLERYGEVAYLCKADLLTEVVGEFPELQGTMGRIYAQLEGQPPEISDAIAEHYLPKGPQDDLPASPLGALLALADKFELLFGVFSLGIRPTASADPYGLRRAAIGISRILLARAWHLPVGKLAESASHIFPDAAALKTAVPAALDFFRGRLEAQLKETYPAEFVAACINVSDDPCEVAGKAEALRKVSAESKTRWVTLLRTAKRAHNIVRAEASLPALNAGAFRQTEETALYQAFKTWQTKVGALPDRKYTDRLRAIVEMADPLNQFFEKVFVMVDDADLKNNRLALIRSISEAFRSYAEFDKIAVTD
ncbi:glycine--tRNA ligase subunit beta [bacterium]|nr:glycine--tRNA ligase subunit beta [bacterium]